MPLQPAQIIASYQILAQIASGGQATVYRARHTVLQREVALKVLHAHLITDASFVQKFAQEAQLLAQLKHPNIVEVHNAGYDAASGAYFIEMELLPGSDLDALIAQQGRLALDVVVNVAKQVASTLEYAHARGLIHRDIKPSNIILLPDGRVKVLDFGIAAIVAAGQKAKTRIGTVEYMAPEHFAGNADARSDIYSLGATLYHMLTGQAPPVVASQPPTPVRQMNPAVSPALGNVILKSLQADAAKRQQTAREFIIEIESALRAPQVSESAPATMQCPHCGAANRVGAKHCATCGRAMAVQPKTYAGALKVKMAIDPLGWDHFEPHFHWSPSGTRLAVLHVGPERAILTLERERELADALSGERPEKLGPPIIEYVRRDSKPDWSPDESKIAYSSFKDQKIWSFDLVSADSKQLTFGNGTHKDPLWSPDGKYIAYTDELGSEICWKILHMPTGRVTPVTGKIFVGWSPSGLRFAVATIGYMRGNISIFQNGLVTQVPVDLGVDHKSINQAAWVSDKEIAISVSRTYFTSADTVLLDIEKPAVAHKWLGVPNFVCAESIPSRVVGSVWNSYLVWADATQGDINELHSTQTGNFCAASDWSSDGTKILFTRTKLGVPNSSEICVVNIDDSGLQKLTDGFNPKWSPDGRYIAFLRSSQDKVYELWVMEVE